MARIVRITWEKLHVNKPKTSGRPAVGGEAGMQATATPAPDHLAGHGPSTFREWVRDEPNTRFQPDPGRAIARTGV